MEDRNFYPSKLGKSKTIGAIILLVGVVLYTAYIAASIVLNGFPRKGDITAFVVISALASLFLFILFLLLKLPRFNGPLLVIHRAGIDLPLLQRKLAWEQIRLAEIVDRDLYIYPKSSVPHEIPRAVKLDRKTYGNLEEILSCIMEGVSNGRSSN